MAVVDTEERHPISEVKLTNVRVLHCVPPALHSGGSVPQLYRDHLNDSVWLPCHYHRRLSLCLSLAL